MPSKGMIVRVRDGMEGYYGHKRRYGKGPKSKDGDIFRIKGPHKQKRKDEFSNVEEIEANDFSKRWMVEIKGAKLRSVEPDVEAVEAEERAQEEVDSELSEALTEGDIVIEEEPEVTPEVTPGVTPEVEELAPVKKKPAKKKPGRPKKDK